MKKRVDQLQIGDRLDLEADEIADPECYNADSTGTASSVRRIDPALDALARRVERIERFLVLEPIGEGK